MSFFFLDEPKRRGHWTLKEIGVYAWTSLVYQPWIPVALQRHEYLTNHFPANRRVFLGCRSAHMSNSGDYGVPGMVQNTAWLHRSALAQHRIIRTTLHTIAPLQFTSHIMQGYMIPGTGNTYQVHSTAVSCILVMNMSTAEPSKSCTARSICCIHLCVNKLREQ